MEVRRYNEFAERAHAILKVPVDEVREKMQDLDEHQLAFLDVLMSDSKQHPERTIRDLIVQAMLKVIRQNPSTLGAIKGIAFHFKEYGLDVARMHRKLEEEATRVCKIDTVAVGANATPGWTSSAVKKSVNRILAEADKVAATEGASTALQHIHLALEKSPDIMRYGSAAQRIDEKLRSLRRAERAQRVAKTKMAKEKQEQQKRIVSEKELAAAAAAILEQSKALACTALRDVPGEWTLLISSLSGGFGSDAVAGRGAATTATKRDATDTTKRKNAIVRRVEKAMEKLNSALVRSESVPIWARTELCDDREEAQAQLETLETMLDDMRSTWRHNWTHFYNS